MRTLDNFGAPDYLPRLGAILATFGIYFDVVFLHFWVNLSPQQPLVAKSSKKCQKKFPKVVHYIPQVVHYMVYITFYMACVCTFPSRRARHDGRGQLVLVLVFAVVGEYKEEMQRYGIRVVFLLYILFDPSSQRSGWNFVCR